MPCSSASTCGCGRGQGILLPVLSCRSMLSGAWRRQGIAWPVSSALPPDVPLAGGLLEELVVAFGNRAGDNQRGTGIVNQYRVHLIDDCVIVLALYEVFRADGHVVAQVVETKFIVRTESDVCKISGGVRRSWVDACRCSPRSNHGTYRAGPSIRSHVLPDSR